MVYTFQAITDAIPKKRSDIYWDNGEKFYRYKSNGKKVPERGMLSIVKRENAETLYQMEQATNRLINGNLSFEDWQRRNIQLIRESHVSMEELGRGGKGRTFGIHYLDVANELRNDQYPYFRRFSQQIKNGELSEAQIRYRQSLYAQGGKISYERGKASASGEKYVSAWYTRSLGSCAPHCQPCINMALMGSVPLGNAVFPGQQCDCGPKCCCSGEVTPEPIR